MIVWPWSAARRSRWPSVPSWPSGSGRAPSCGARPRPSFAELVLVGPDADNLYDQHQIRQARFGNSAESGAIDVELVEPGRAGAARLLKGAARRR